MNDTNKKKILIDIGARGGILTTFPDGTNRFLAPILAKNFRIVQFEPDPSYRLDRVSKHFGCELVPKGVGLTTGPATLHITNDPYKSSIFEPNLAKISMSFHGNVDDYVVERTVEVECIAISDIIAKYADSADIWLKIDAQGIEGDIVAALGERISQVKVIIAELSSIEQYRKQLLSQHILAYLFDAGFHMFFSNYKKMRPTKTISSS